MMKTYVIPVAVMMGVSAAAAELPYDGQGHVMLDPAAPKWSDVASIAAPAKISVIEGDLTKEEPFTFRLKLPAGCEINPHTHPAYERVTVISGTLHFAHGERFERDKTTALPQGGVAIMPPGAPMYCYTEEDTDSEPLRVLSVMSGFAKRTPSAWCSNRLSAPALEPV